MLLAVLSFELGAVAGAIVMLAIWTVERIFRAGGWKGGTSEQLKGLGKQGDFFGKEN